MEVVKIVHLKITVLVLVVINLWKPIITVKLIVKLKIVIYVKMKNVLNVMQATFRYFWDKIMVLLKILIVFHSLLALKAMEFLGRTVRFQINV